MFPSESEMRAEIMQSDLISHGPKNYTNLDLTAGFGNENNKRLGLHGASGDIVKNTIVLCGGKNYKEDYVNDCIISNGSAWNTKIPLMIPR